ncbi:MAG: lipocalin family protein [Bacteroidales bacterium]
MKKFRVLNLFLLFAFSVILTSCHIADDEPEDLIVGEWEVTRSAGWEIQGGIKTVWDEPRGGVFWMFFDDGTGYVLDETEIVSRPAYFDWRVSNDRLIVNSSGDVFIYDIVSLNYSRMLIDVHILDVDYEGRWTETFSRVR